MASCRPLLRTSFVEEKEEVKRRFEFIWKMGNIVILVELKASQKERQIKQVGKILQALALKIRTEPDKYLAQEEDEDKDEEDEEDEESEDEEDEESEEEEDEEEESEEDEADQGSEEDDCSFLIASFCR